MSNGFGQSLDELKAIELCMVAHSKGYDTELSNNIIKVTNQSGMQLSVESANDKYIVKRKDKDISYKSIGATVKGIGTAFNMLRNESNKRYE